MNTASDITKQITLVEYNFPYPKLSYPKSIVVLPVR